MPAFYRWPTDLAGGKAPLVQEISIQSGGECRQPIDDDKLACGKRRSDFRDSGIGGKRTIRGVVGW